MTDPLTPPDPLEAPTCPDCHIEMECTGTMWECPECNNREDVYPDVEPDI